MATFTLTDLFSAKSLKNDSSTVKNFSSAQGSMSSMFSTGSTGSIDSSITNLSSKMNINHSQINSFAKVKKEILNALNVAYKSQRSKNRKKKYWIFKEPDEFNMIKNRQFKTNLLEVVDVLQKAFLNDLSWREIIKESLTDEKIDLATYISAMKDFLIQNRIKCAYLTKMYIHKFYIDYVQSVIYFNVYKKNELSSAKFPRIFFKNVFIDELINQVTVKTNLK